MGLKNDDWIIESATLRGMIKPFSENQVRNVFGGWDSDGTSMPALPIISFGTSSYGYDMRVANHFKIFTNQFPGIIDPKCFEDNLTLQEVVQRDGFVIVPPNSFALAHSVEYFRIPRDVLCIVLGKSTYARCGIVVNITALEPEWEGQVTIEISNTTPLPAKIYVNEGIAQVLFFEADAPCIESYADKHGKYQGQTGITLPKC